MEAVLPNAANQPSIPPNFLTNCEAPNLRGNRNEDLLYYAMELKESLDKCNAKISGIRDAINDTYAEYPDLS
jgi:hypothetical protein